MNFSNSPRLGDGWRGLVPAETDDERGFASVAEPAQAREVN